MAPGSPCNRRTPGPTGPADDDRTGHVGERSGVRDAEVRRAGVTRRSPDSLDPPAQASRHRPAFGVERNREQDATQGVHDMARRDVPCVRTARQYDCAFARSQ